MSYHQLTPGERYVLSALRKQGLSQAAIARAMERHPSTVSRELRRNLRQNAYRPCKANKLTRGRRSRSRRNQRFSAANWALITSLLQQLWSPEQIVGRLGEERRLPMSHETIYRYVWHDRRRGGTLYGHLRQAQEAATQLSGPETCDWHENSARSRRVNRRSIRLFYL